MDSQKSETTIPTSAELSQKNSKEIKIGTPYIKSYIRNIQDTKEIAEKLDIPLILDCGSLLGAYRDGEPIEKDYDDIDFAVPFWVAQHKLLPLIKEFQARNFFVVRLRDTTICFKRDGVKIDLLFYKKGFFSNAIELDGTQTAVSKEYYYFTLYFKQIRYALLTELEAYDNLGKIKYLEMEFDCPKNIEKHLEHRYGEWRTPILRPKFTFKNYIDRGVMIKL